APIPSLVPCSRYTPPCVFFFQAEDGIRDRNVTGVQTCALPIFERLGVRAQPFEGVRYYAPFKADGVNLNTLRTHPDLVGDVEPRSEERRVGKECRTGGLVAR